MSSATHPDWVEISRQAGQAGTQWQFTPKGCAWRNGQAERAIGMAKRTLTRLLTKGKTLDIHEMDALLHRVAYILNNRPIAIRTSIEGEYHSITPSDILLGRAARSRPNTEALEPIEDDESIHQALTHQEEVVRAWWTDWTKQAFPELVPRTTWKTSHRNVCTGDIVHVRYDKKFSQPRYRLARIVKVLPDEHGIVRSCVVAMRPRREGETGDKKYKHKPAEELTLGVQRIAVLLPVEEQSASESLPQQEQESHIESPGLRRTEEEPTQSTAPSLPGSPCGEQGADIYMTPLDEGHHTTDVTPAPCGEQGADIYMTPLDESHHTTDATPAPCSPPADLPRRSVRIKQKLCTHASILSEPSILSTHGPAVSCPATDTVPLYPAQPQRSPLGSPGASHRQ